MKERLRGKQRPGSGPAHSMFPVDKKKRKLLICLNHRFFVGGDFALTINRNPLTDRAPTNSGMKSKRLSLPLFGPAHPSSFHFLHSRTINSSVPARQHWKLEVWLQTGFGGGWDSEKADVILSRGEHEEGNKRRQRTVYELEKKKTVPAKLDGG